MILMKWQYNETCHFLGVDIYHFQLSLINPFKKWHWKLDIIGSWVIGAGCQIEKSLEPSPRPLNHSKDFRTILPSFTSINCMFGTLMSCGSKDMLKRYIVSCTNTHHDITDLAKHQLVEDTKIWISQILNLCLRWYILRNYCFVAEVTSNSLAEIRNLENLKFLHNCSNKVLQQFIFTFYFHKTMYFLKQKKSSSKWIIDFLSKN